MKRVASYRLHKPTGQALVCLSGRRMYLGQGRAGTWQTRLIKGPQRKSCAAGVAHPKTKV